MLTSKENTVKLENGLVILQNLSRNRDFIFYHHIYVRKYNNKLLRMELHPSYLLLTHHSTPLPTDPYWKY